MEQERAIAVPANEVLSALGNVCENCMRYSAKIKTLGANDYKQECNKGEWRCMHPSIVWMTPTQLALMRLEAT